MNDDIQHLRYLTIAHYIGAAMTALFACFPLIYLSAGLTFLLNLPTTEGSDPFPVQLFGVMFALIGGMAVLWWAFAALIFVAGRSLAARKRYTFCFVIAALCCASFPLGTVLGVFTILVLTRPTVKAMFQRQTALGVPPESVPHPGAWRDQTFAERSDR
jgi:hypothetical protein